MIAQCCKSNIHLNNRFLIIESVFDSKAVTLFNEAVNANNEAEDLKGLQKAADCFLKNCYKVGIDYDNR